jgi:threonine dehydratase
MSDNTAIRPEDVRRAHARIAPWVRRTPLLEGDAAPFGAASLVFKLELLQHAGSFKTRGAYHHLLSRAVPPAGVAAASGGNHGVAVALAARRLGHRARVFVPEIASPVKVAAIQRQGAEIVVGGARYADAQAACDAFAAASGALTIHPFDARETLEATGTVALEWEQDLARASAPLLDTVLVASGGGGLVAGMAAYWARRVKVIAVEPEGSRCLHAALEAGHLVDVPVESVAADSLGARRAGDLVFAVAKDLLDGVVLVPDDAIGAAQALLWRDYRIAAEPGGAAALGALVSGSYRPAAGERVGVLVCGGNVDLGQLAALAKATPF